MERVGKHLRVVLALLLVLTLLLGSLAVVASAMEGTQTATGTGSDPAGGSESHVSTPWYTVDYADGKLNVAISADISVYTSLRREDLSALKDNMLKTLYALVFDRLMGTAEPGMSGAEFDISAIDPSTVDMAQLEQFLHDQLKKQTPEESKQQIQSVLDGKYDTLLQIGVDKYIEEKGYTYEEITAKVDQVMTDIIEEVYADAPAEEKQAVQEQSSTKVTEVVSEVKEAKDNGQTITVSLTDVVNSISAVTVNSHPVYGDDGAGSGAVILTDGVRALLGELPTLDEIQGWSDDRMYLDYAIAVSTVFGDITFDAHLSLFGDCEQVRTLARVIADHVSFSRRADGTLALSVTVPDILARAINKAVKSGVLSDELVHKIFNNMTSDLNDAYALYEDLTFDDVMELLGKVDFEGLLDREQIRKYVVLTGYTNEQILDKIREYEGAYNRLCRLFEKAFARIPDSYKTKNILSLYEGDGLFAASGSVTVNIRKVLDRLVPDQAAHLAAFFDREQITVSADVRVSFDRINRVTYKVDTTVVREGLLPAGADIVYFADLTSYEGRPILGWQLADGTPVTEMPDGDTVLYAKLGGSTLDVTTLASVNAVYDKLLSYTVGVTPLYTGIGTPSYTYSWTKNGTSIGTNTATFTVSDVADSGTYVCTVTVSDGEGTLTVTSDPITVVISRQTVDVSAARWNHTGLFTYDNSEKVLTLTGIPEGAVPTYTGNRATEVGNYVAKVTFAPENDNYQLTGTVADLAWSIARIQLDVSGASWNYSNPFTYDGEEHSVTLTGLPDGITVILSGEKAVNAGSYTASATLTLTDPVHTEIVGTVADLSWSIAPKTVDVSGARWNYTAPFTYNGEEKRIELVGIPDGVVATYEGNRATEVGSYTAKVTFAATNGNYQVAGTVADLSWSIAPKTVDVSGARWNYTAPFTYDGTEHTVTLVGLPDGVTLVLSGHKATNVGTYTATATLTAVDPEHTVITGTVAPLSWTVNKAQVDLSTMRWNYTAPFVYDGTAHTVALTGVPAALRVIYTGNSATNAGVYTARAELHYDVDNCEYTGIAPATELEWTVERAVLDMSGIRFSDVRVKYDGHMHGIRIEGTLPSGVTVTYTPDKKLGGTYTMVAHFTVNETNYCPIPDMTAQLTIYYEYERTFTYVDTAGNTILTVVAANGIPSHFRLITVDNSTLLTDTEAIGRLFGDNKSVVILVSYDIHFEEDGTEQSYADTYVVRMLIPASLRDKTALKVVHVADDGTASDMEAVRDGDYMTFTTTHFSTYAIVEVVDAPAQEEGSPLWLWILLAVLVVILVIVILIFVRLRHRGGDEPTEAPLSDEEPEPAPVAPIAEIMPDPVEPEPVVEEPVAVEPVAEVEPEPVVEEPVAEVVPEPVVVPVVSGDDEEALGRRVVNGQIVFIHYRSSFMSRLIQSQPPIQDYYTVLKNYLMSFKGIKARTSWNYESFNKGRIQCAKLNVKGRALLIYLGLDPVEYNVNKYHFVDVSDKPKFDKVPMLLKVKSDRSLKYAIELIDEVMQKNSIEQQQVMDVDYHMPYETTDELADRDLVKIIYPDDVVIDENTSIRKLNVGEMLSFANERAAERAAAEPVAEPVAEEAPAAEPANEPVVEEVPAAEPVEEPVVEEVPAAEPVEEPAVEEVPATEPVEEPVVEEAPAAEPANEPVVEEAPAAEPVEESIHITADEADTMVSDDEADASIEILPIRAASGGKMGEINLDTICENYENGDTVDLASLQQKRLISASCRRLKVLARGTMTKRLTVVADRYSLQAVKMIVLAGGKAEKLS